MEIRRIWNYYGFVLFAALSLLFTVIGTVYFDISTSEEQEEYRQMEQSEIEEYPSHIDAIEENVSSISLIYDSNSYAVKSAQKTLEKYNQVKDVDLKNEPSYGVNKIFEKGIAEGILFVLCIFFSFFYVVRDRELKMYSLLTVTSKGIRRLFVSRFLSAAFKLTIWFLLIYMFKTGYFYLKYGFYDLSRSVQSLYLMKDCVLKISVGEYLGLWLLTRYVTLMLLFTFIYSVCIWVKHSVNLILILSATFVGEYVLYSSIDSSSNLNILRWLNIDTICFTDDYLRFYDNISILGCPVDVLFMIIITSIVVFCVCFCLIIFGYCSLEARFVKRGTGRKTFKKDDKCLSLTGWEILKLIKLQRVGLVIICFVIVVILTYNPSKTYYGDLEEAEYKAYMTEYAGKLTEEKNDAIQLKKEEYSEIEDKIENLDADQIGTLISLEKKLDGNIAFQRVLQKCNYIQQNDEGELVYDTGYEWLLGKRGIWVLLRIFIILFAFTAVSIAGVWSYDKMLNISALIGTTRNGIKNRNKVLCFISIIIYTFYYIVLFGLRLHAVFSIYGDSGLLSNAGGLMVSVFKLDGLNILMTVILSHIIYYIIGLFFIVFCLFISKKMKSYMQAIIVSLCCCVLSCWVLYLGMCIILC